MLVRQVVPLTGPVFCGRSDPKFAAEPLLNDRFCLLYANHTGLHIAGKNLSFDREVERYMDES